MVPGLMTPGHLMRQGIRVLDPPIGVDVHHAARAEALLELGVLSANPARR